MIDMDGRIGEAWAGEVPNGSHINVVIAKRGSPTAGALAGALASPGPGHLRFLACLSPGVVVRPLTIVVNKVTLEPGSLHERLTWGAAHLGIAQGVLDAVADGALAGEEAADLLLAVAVWVDPAAGDETALRQANRTATRAAIADALTPVTAEAMRALAARRDEAANGYYQGS
jgi:5,6,7,8-tetrahydromethanopterin hydro-lyase